MAGHKPKGIYAFKYQQNLSTSEQRVQYVWVVYGILLSKTRQLSRKSQFDADYGPTATLTKREYRTRCYE